MSLDLDRQLGDFIWSISCGLRAGYSIRQVLEALSAEAPEPSASAARRFVAEMDEGGMESALQTWGETEPGLSRLAGLIELQRQTGENLADLLDPLGEEMLREYGSDPAFYACMRRQAEALGANLPERVTQS